MFGKHYDDFSDILYNERLGHYMVYVGDTLQGEVISDQEINVSDEIELSTSDDTYFFTFKSPTSITAHATIEIDGNFYKFEILSRKLTVNRVYYSQEVSTQIFESITYENSELGLRVSIPRENYKYYITEDIQNNTQDSFSIEGNYVVLNPNFRIMDGDMLIEYNVVLNIEYDRLINVIPHYIHWGTSDEITDLESEIESFYFKDQYEVKAPYIEGFTAVYPAQDEHETNYEKETFLYVPDNLKGGGSINLYYFYQAEQSEPEEYTIAIHHQDWDTGATIHEDTYKTVKETDLTQIQSYQKVISGYNYYCSIPDQDFYPTEDTEITLYYEKVEIPYTLYVHQVKSENGDEFEDTAQYNNLPADRIIIISNYIKEWPGYIYKSSSPRSNFAMQEQATNYEVHLYLYYEEQPKDPCESECQNCEGDICLSSCQNCEGNVCLSECQTGQNPPPEEETKDIAFGWMTNGNGKFAPKTLGDNFITDAKSKARVFQYGTSAPSKLQKGAIYFVI